MNSLLSAGQEHEFSLAIHRQSREAADRLESVLHAPWHEIMLGCVDAERLAVSLRDQLIQGLREMQPGENLEDKAVWESMLAKVNVALSLIAGIEYPSNAIRREIIQIARDVLREV